jgi:hypothetical protein
MFKTVMICAFAFLGVCWTAYWIYEWQLRVEEKRTPRRKRPTTEHLEQVKKSFEEYARKLEEYELKAYDKEEK